MASLSEFSKRMVLRGRQVADNTDKLVRKVALAADQAIVMRTPVDTGRARANWIVNIGSAAPDVIEAYAPGKDGNTAAANTQAALDQAEATIKNYVGGNEIHITNNLPYIQRLNDGYSAQAPRGFVQETIQAAAQAVSESRLVAEEV